MLWLESPPWGRWLAAALIAIGAIWAEFRPDSLIEHPFATERIERGDVIAEQNTEYRRVPTGLFEPVVLGLTALANVEEGEPLLASKVGDPDEVIPSGWWSIEIELPPSASRGDAARVLILSTGVMVDAVVVSAWTDDSFGTPLGALAVAPEHASEVAAASELGDVAVMVETG